MTKRERPVLTAAQVRILLEGTDGDWGVDKAGHCECPKGKDCREPGDHPIDPLHALWVLAATTGMRLGEMLALTWEDVELGEGPVSDDGPLASASQAAGPGVSLHRVQMRGPAVTIRNTLHREAGKWVLRDPKTERSRRTIPLTPLAVEALRALRQRQYEEKVDGAVGAGAAEPVDAGLRRAQGRDNRSGLAADLRGQVRDEPAGRAEVRGEPVVLAARRNSLIFTTRRGQPLNGPNLPKELAKACARLDLPRVRIHDLRHGYAAILLSEGVELITVSRMLGHSSIRITADIYTKVMPNLTLDAAEKMRRAVG